MISIIVSCYNAEKYIKNCLNAVFASRYDDFEVIAIDDFSTDKTVPYLRSFKKRSNFRLLQNKCNLGPSISRNRATKQAKGTILFFLDNDTIIHENCLKNIAVFMSAHPTSGGGQCLLLKNEKTVESAGNFLSFVGFPYGVGVNERIDKFQSTFYILGSKTAGCVIRKKIFQTLRGFDEDMRMHLEDTDINWRAWFTGYTMNFIPTAKIIHINKGTPSLQTKKQIVYEGSKNMMKMLIKNLEIATLFWVLPVNITTWIVVMFRFLITGQPYLSLLVWKGISWNIWNIHHTLGSRALIQKSAKRSLLTNHIIFGPLSFQNILAKGWRWISHV